MGLVHVTLNLAYNIRQDLTSPLARPSLTEA